MTTREQPLAKGAGENTGAGERADLVRELAELTRQLARQQNEFNASAANQIQSLEHEVQDQGSILNTQDHEQMALTRSLAETATRLAHFMRRLEALEERLSALMERAGTLEERMTRLETEHPEGHEDA